MSTAVLSLKVLIPVILQSLLKCITEVFYLSVNSRFFRYTSNLHNTCQMHNTSRSLSLANPLFWGRQRPHPSLSTMQKPKYTFTRLLRKPCGDALALSVHLQKLKPCEWNLGRSSIFLQSQLNQLMGYNTALGGLDMVSRDHCFNMNMMNWTTQKLYLGTASHFV